MCSISACGLQCYQCIGTKSWDDCESVKTKVNCSSSENRCSKAYRDIKKGGVSVKDYGKGCISADFCKTATDTDACKEGTCELDCCSGDLCNAATVPLVSTIIFSVCAVLATLSVSHDQSTQVLQSIAPSFGKRIIKTDSLLGLVSN